MYCWDRKQPSFEPAQYPICNDANVGFSLTYANLLYQTLPPGHGVVIISTGVGGTGFHDHNWGAPNGTLLLRSVYNTQQLFQFLPSSLGGSATLHSMLWHQGELDAGDNGAAYQATYCTYLMDDLSNMIDYVREKIPTASSATPFLDGGLLPFWEDKISGTSNVQRAIYSLNSSRACTGTADSRVFADLTPDGRPNGDPNYRSGVSGLVIHFDATQAFFMGFQYWRAYLNSLQVTSVVSNSETLACGAPLQPTVPRCG